MEGDMVRFRVNMYVNPDYFVSARFYSHLPLEGAIANLVLDVSALNCFDSTT